MRRTMLVRVARPRTPLALAALIAAVSGGCGDAGAASAPGAGTNVASTDVAGAAGGGAGRGSAGGAGSVGASGAGAGGTGGAASVSYMKHVAPIFESHCVSCHQGGGIGLDLREPFDPVNGLIDRANRWHQEYASLFEWLVKRGDPDASFLIYKVAGDPANFDAANNGAPMPLQLPYLNAQELADVRQWITDGAHDDAFFAQKVAPLFGTEVTLGANAGRCTYCHAANSSTGLNILQVFDPTTGLVGAGSNFSSKLRVTPGNPAESFVMDKLQPDPGG